MAGSAEIKTAFRRLAKIYHPDKNPQGRDDFTKILKAYEVLSDPIQKASFDYRLNYQTATTGTQERRTSTPKTWRFDEKELKRRQYYNDYIKKQTQEASQTDSTVETKKAYSDYKYIFFATPLAVILFLLIMNLATTRTPLTLSHISRNYADTTSGETYDSPITGSDIYESVFLKGEKIANDTISMTLKNYRLEDAIVILFSGNIFLRSIFIKSNDSISLPGLPVSQLSVKVSSGYHFDSQKTISGVATNGFFKDKLHFYKKIKSIKPEAEKELILTGDTVAYTEISAQEFFQNK